MANRNFMQLLRARWDKGLSVCVGLDSDYELLPSIYSIYGVSAQIFTFNNRIIDATAEYALAFKPNFAFYFAYGLEGLRALEMTISYIVNTYAEIPVILDEKIGDIGKTNDLYVKAIFNAFLHADGVTAHNYLGQKAMQPFLDKKDKGVIVLCRTSNPGAGEFQDLEIPLNKGKLQEVEEYFGHEVHEGSLPMYQYVAYRVARHWNQNGNCALVTGATYPTELAAVRKIVRDGFPLLIPGIGTQGGDLEKTVLAGKDSNGQGMIINSSSGIIFASKGEDFADVARRRTIELHDEIGRILAAQA